MRTRRVRSHLGFTLIENLIAMVILTVGVLVLANTLARTIRFDFFNKASSSGLLLDNKQAEEIVRRYHRMRTPCTGAACGSFTDSDGTTVSLADTPTHALDASGNIDFTQPAQPGYQKFVTMGNDKYDVRWDITTAGTTIGAVTYYVHQITVGAKSTSPINAIPVSIHAATP